MKDDNASLEDDHETGSQAESLLVEPTASDKGEGGDRQPLSGFQSPATTLPSVDTEPGDVNLDSTEADGNPALDKAVNQLVHIQRTLRKIQKDMYTYIREPDLEARLGLAELQELVESVRSQARGEILAENENEGALAGTHTLPDVDAILVDDTQQVLDLLKSITGLTTNHRSSPTFYFDCEGKDLGRHGTITLLAIYAPHLRQAFVIDLQKLGQDAFNVEHDGKTLKTIFESPKVLKGVFDCRGDSDALFAHHGIELAGIVDVQLMEAATRKNSKRLFGLDACIKSRLKDLDPAAKHKFSHLKAQVKELIRSEEDGSCFSERPLPELLLNYAASDTIVLPTLYEYFLHHESYWGEWPSRVENETQKRLELSRDPRYDPSKLDMRAGPEEWIKMSRATKK